MSVNQSATARLSSSVMASTTACASNSKSSNDDDSETSGISLPAYFLTIRLCQKPTVHQGGKKTLRDVPFSLPSDVADAHRPHDGLPIAIELARRENLHEGAPRRALHEHRVREVIAKHAQHDRRLRERPHAFHPRRVLVQHVHPHARP